MESARPSLLAAETSTLLWAFVVIFLIFFPELCLARAIPPGAGSSTQGVGFGVGEAPHGDTSVLHAPGTVLPAQAVLVEMSCWVSAEMG